MALASSVDFVPTSSSRFNASRNSRLRRRPAPSTVNCAAGWFFPAPHAGTTPINATKKHASRRSSAGLLLCMLLVLTCPPAPENAPFHAGHFFVKFVVLAGERPTIGKLVFN